jgi:hypothetical protein
MTHNSLKSSLLKTITRLYIKTRNSRERIAKDVNTSIVKNFVDKFKQI